MCGIAGFWAPTGATSPAQPRDVLERMASSIQHRGPDAAGYWHDSELGVGLAHRRLSILDLSPAGAQPMRSQSGRYIIVYNGEIYNHRNIRAALDAEIGARAWQGHSDTETLLAAIEAWGLTRALQTANGMFALAVWDEKTKQLMLARDRLGEKPLFYGKSDDTLLFGSELKAVCAYPGFQRIMNLEAATAFLRYSYVPAPLSIFTGIKKLMPGQVATFSDPASDPETSSYWTLDDAVEQTSASRQSGKSLEHHASELETVLTQVIETQMISDVPIGAFLSGGIDSSLIVSLMQKVSTSPVRTFAIGFEDERFNEAKHAADVAEHLKTDHTELILTESNMLDVAQDICTIYDEPFADSSLLPSILLSQMTREHVTVALSGDGGDEMFAGYNRHILGPKLWRRTEKTPKMARQAAGRLAALGERITASMPSLSSRAMHTLNLPVTMPDKLARFGHTFAAADSMEEMYDLLVATGQEVDAPHGINRFHRSDAATPSLELSAAEQITIWDTQTYLSDDILVKVDRAAMASSLETRAPFLDKRTIEAAWSIPIEHKLGVHGTKTVLREILYQHIPKRLIERPKQGFAIPLNEWLRGRLFDWAAQAVEGYRQHAELRPFLPAIERAWDQHQAGTRQNGALLFNAIILSEWLGGTKRADTVTQ